MGKLRSVKPSDAIKVFESLGFKVKRRKGSHVAMTREGTTRPLVIPDHGDLAIGTLASNIGTAGITKEEFERILNSI